MDKQESTLTPETLYTFMERIPYVTGHCTGVSRRLSVLLPAADDGDIAYCGQITEHDRKEPDHIPWQLDFSFSKCRGIYDVSVRKEGNAMLLRPAMPAAEFYELVERRFPLGPAPACTHPDAGRQRKCVWNTVPLPDVLCFLSDAPAAINSHLMCSIRIARHPKAHDIVYQGSLWIDGPPRKRKRLYDRRLDFYYSDACGIHDVYATAKGKLATDVNYMAFDHFQMHIQKLFTPTYQAPRTLLAEPTKIIRRIRSSK